MVANNKSPRPTVLRINRLKGRMLALPAPRGKKQEIVIIYGLHSNLESVRALANTLNKYGAVTVPDLPGMGGMSSFYSIGTKPSMDNFASYLASFIELRFHRRKHLIVVAVGEGALFVTRLLQNHAKAAAKIDGVVTVGGMLHKNDIPSLRSNRLIATAGYRLASTKSIAWLVSRFRFGWLITSIHQHKKQAPGIRKLDVRLWQQCDVRTRMSLKRQLLSVDVCGTTIDKPLKIIWADMPPRVDMGALNQHAMIVYKRVADFMPSPVIKDWSDLQDEERLQKMLGTKLRGWL